MDTLKPATLESADTAAVGDAVDPTTLPAEVVAEGGGWLGNRYFVKTYEHQNPSPTWICSQIGGRISG